MNVRIGWLVAAIAATGCVGVDRVAVPRILSVYASCDVRADRGAELQALLARALASSAGEACALLKSAEASGRFVGPWYTREDGQVCLAEARRVACHEGTPAFASSDKEVRRVEDLDALSIAELALVAGGQLSPKAVTTAAAAKLLERLARAGVEDLAALKSLEARCLSREWPCALDVQVVEAARRARLPELEVAAGIDELLAENAPRSAESLLGKIRDPALRAPREEAVAAALERRRAAEAAEAARRAAERARPVFVKEGIAWVRGDVLAGYREEKVPTACERFAIDGVSPEVVALERGGYRCELRRPLPEPLAAELARRLQRNAEALPSERRDEARIWKDLLAARPAAAGCPGGLKPYGLFRAQAELVCFVELTPAQLCMRGDSSVRAQVGGYLHARSEGCVLRTCPEGWSDLRPPSENALEGCYRCPAGTALDLRETVAWKREDLQVGMMFGRPSLDEVLCKGQRPAAP